MGDCELVEEPGHWVTRAESLRPRGFHSAAEEPAPRNSSGECSQCPQPQPVARKSSSSARAPRIGAKSETTARGRSLLAAIAYVKQERAAARTPVADPAGWWLAGAARSVSS